MTTFNAHAPAPAPPIPIPISVTNPHPTPPGFFFEEMFWEGCILIVALFSVCPSVMVETQKGPSPFIN